MTARNKFMLSCNNIKAVWGSIGYNNLCLQFSYLKIIYFITTNKQYTVYYQDYNFKLFLHIKNCFSQTKTSTMFQNLNKITKKVHIKIVSSINMIKEALKGVKSMSYCMSVCIITSGKKGLRVSNTHKTVIQSWKKLKKKEKSRLFLDI